MGLQTPPVALMWRSLLITPQLILEIVSRRTQSLILWRRFPMSLTKWEESLKVANSSGCSYNNGDSEKLKTQLKTLEERWNNTAAADNMKRWLMICTKQNLFNGIPNIFDFAQSCFLKAPLETPAKTLGIVINQHACLQRCSLSPASLSSDVHKYR